MPNPIKYNTSAETLALKKGNFWIGTGDVGKGPTSSTGFYNGITPPAGGFTIYLNKETSGPSIYTVSTEAQLVSLTNTIGVQSFTTSGQCLNWFATQTDKMVFNIDYPAIITDGLVLNVDAGFTPSYPTTGATWYNVSSGGNNGTLTNTPTFNSSNGGSIVFDGVDDWVQIPTYTFGNGNWTVIAWVNANTTTDYNILSNSSGGPVSNAFGFQSNKIAYRNYDGAWQERFGNTTLSTGNWYMLTWVNYAGASAVEGTIQMFVNGISDSSIFNSYTTNGGPCDAIGRNWFSYYNGRICSLQFYTKSLTSSEILQNFNAQKGRFGL